MTFVSLSSWTLFNSADRPFCCCTGHGRRIFSCHIQHRNVSRVCRVVLLSRNKMDGANSISSGRLPGWSVDAHPSNGSYPSLPTTTVFPIESIGHIFRVAISAANNTTRRWHGVKATGWTRQARQSPIGPTPMHKVSQNPLALLWTVAPSQLMTNHRINSLYCELQGVGLEKRGQYPSPKDPRTWLSPEGGPRRFDGWQ